MAGIDPNEVFAWVRAVGNPDTLRQLQQTISARLADMQQAGMGPAGQHLLQPHVQPTAEATPGSAAMPLVGPDPQGRGGNIFGQAERNERTMRAQAASARGPGYQPVATHIGGESEEESRQSQQVLSAYAEHQQRVSNPRLTETVEQGAGSGKSAAEESTGQKPQGPAQGVKEEQITRPATPVSNWGGMPGGGGSQGPQQQVGQTSKPAGQEGGQQQGAQQGGQQQQEQGGGQQGAKQGGGQGQAKPSGRPVPSLRPQRQGS